MGEQEPAHAGFSRPGDHLGGNPQSIIKFGVDQADVPQFPRFNGPFHVDKRRVPAVFEGNLADHLVGVDSLHNLGGFGTRSRQGFLNHHVDAGFGCLQRRFTVGEIGCTDDDGIRFAFQQQITKIRVTGHSPFI